MANLNKIVFILSTELRQKYDLVANTGLFNGDNLVLPVWREDYNAANSMQVKVIKGLTSPIVDVQKDYFQFEATVRDSRATVGYILKELMELSSAICGTYQLITCWDYHRLDTETDRTNGYTVRQGVLQYEVSKGSIRGTNGSNYTGGHRIIFTQVA